MAQERELFKERQWEGGHRLLTSVGNFRNHCRAHSTVSMTMAHVPDDSSSTESQGEDKLEQNPKPTHGRQEVHGGWAWAGLDLTWILT